MTDTKSTDTKSIHVEKYLRSLDDSAGIRECLDKYGVVAVTGILSEKECEETVEERVLALQSRKQKLADSVYGKEQEENFAPDNSDALLKLFERY